MAALTLNSSKRFLKSLNQLAFQDVRGSDFDGERIFVGTPAVAVSALKAHGWSRERKFGRARIMTRADGTWPVTVHRSYDGYIAVELPVVDTIKEFNQLAAAQEPSASLKDVVREWVRIQESLGYNVVVEWMDPTNPRFDPEFLHSPGINVATHPPGKLPLVKMRQLKDAATLLGYDPVGYVDRAAGMTYYDLYFVKATR